MDIKVTTKYLRISPRKVRPVLFGLRGKNALEAQTQMKFTNKKGADNIFAVLNTGIAIAKENDFDTNNLIVKSITCNEGPRLKRRHIGSRGRLFPIMKRTSHLNLVLETVEASEPEAKEINKEKETITKKQ